MNVIVDREKGLLELEQRIKELKSQVAHQPVDMSAPMSSRLPVVRVADLVRAVKRAGWMEIRTNA